MPEAVPCPHGHSVLDFTDRDPFGFYTELSSLPSPVWDEKAEAWLVHDFRQCLDCQRNEQRFANMYMDADPITVAIKGGGANITLSQGEDHLKLRRFHFRLLSVANVERYRSEHIGPVIDGLLDRLPATSPVDLAADYAAQIPPRVICALLGMPTDDATVTEILDANEAIVRFIASGYRDMGLRDLALAASKRLNEMLLPYVHARRDNPTGDFISRIWQEAPTEGINLDEAGVMGICREIFFAGSDTSVHGIANALYLILAEPALKARVMADQDKALSSLVEESLRLMNVVQFRHRRCLADTQIGDVTVRQGHVIILLHAAANRDAARFPCPNAVDLDRPDPTAHLAFGKGVRSCVGAQLARVETQEALARLLARYPDVALSAEGPAPYFRALYMRSMGPLWVALNSPLPASQTFPQTSGL
ncbi:cytochrome P450 [Niveispirillum sp. KHB5.9]|uniref:cytochrome P450 n=1 Tax=Niveispirillum sp. KHB5.9 TaxID=3400269 RepID=UPI003A892696